MKTSKAPPDRPDVLPRVALGDDEAVSICLDRYGALIWSLASRSLPNRDQAEDAVQEIFIHLWEKAEKFDPERGSEIAFVTTLARRRLIDRMRRTQSRVKPDDLAEIEIPQDDSGLEAVDVGDEARRAREALNELQPEHRKIVLLSVVGGLSHGEISKETGMPLGTVKSIIRRAFEKVRGLLAQDDYQKGGVIA
ncbi:MAG: sigma-70 family RNA polymerase sigma factor [Planctomycetota bacterium]